MDGRTEVVLRLEGRLVGRWVSEVRRAAHAARSSGMPVTVDLSRVSFVDSGGIELARELRDYGFTLTNCSRFVAELLKGVAPC
jgi:anti-anti-sigma regulatory factor